MIRFVVYGTPAPQGSKKFVGMHGGHGVMVESSKKVRPWRQDVKAAAEAAITGAPLDGALEVSMIFTLPKPTSAPKTRRTWPSKKPDVSKLVRSTEDAITDAGLWTDDSRVVNLIAGKRFPGEGADALDRPGVVVTIRQLEVEQQAALPLPDVGLAVARSHLDRRANADFFEGATA